MTNSERIKEIKSQLTQYMHQENSWDIIQELLDIVESHAAEIEEGRKSEQGLLDIIESQGLEIGELKKRLAYTVDENVSADRTWPGISVRNGG